MSGIEVAGLVFGVLPILIEAVKSYSTVADALRTFTHYSREVKSISQRLDTQNAIFHNHCKLLLLLVEDKKAAEAMFEDPTHTRWKSKDLDDKLNAVLEDSLGHCQKIIEGTKDVLDEVREEIGNFDVFIASKNKDETIKRTIKRLKGAIKITVNKSNYEKCLTRLREQNNDLGLLHSQTSAFQKHFESTRTTGSLLRAKVLPERFRSVHNASQKLHEALCSAWRCDNAEHRGHYAKLCLDAEVQTEVRLDLAISCHETFDGSNDSLVHEPPIWLYVRSTSLTAPQRAWVTSQAVKVTASANIPKNVSLNPLKKKASSDLEQAGSSRKKKHVQWVDTVDDTAVNVGTMSPISQITLPEFNLCQTKDMCNYLKRNKGMCVSSMSKDCLGYLETPCHMYKHNFYLGNRGLNTGAVHTTDHSTVYSIFDTMRYTSANVIDIEDQLKLAHKAAVAMLQYNDTPWLAGRWRLSNMSYFGNRHVFEDTALKTLHLSSQISQPNHTTAMEGVQTTVDDELKYGVVNAPLFFLGVALLEIAHWQPLESSMCPQDEGNQIITARRLANGRSSLGPEYQQIIRRCLQCNFGFGTKLESKRLQTAVYNDVVCKLEGMIED